MTAAMSEEPKSTLRTRAKVEFLDGEIREGDILTVDAEQTKLKNGQVYLVNDGGKANIIRWHKGDGRKRVMGRITQCSRILH